jgi:hypothetical protein
MLLGPCAAAHPCLRVLTTKHMAWHGMLSMGVHGAAYPQHAVHDIIMNVHP